MSRDDRFKDVLMYPKEQSGGTDIPAKSLDTLGSYLSDITQGKDTAPNPASGNKFPIGADVAKTKQFGANGKPAPIVTGGQNEGDKTFWDVLGESEKLLFEMTSESGNFDAADPTSTPLSAFLDKNSQSDGHEILAKIKSIPAGGDSPRSAPIPPDVPVVQKKISSLLSNNRFNARSDEKETYIFEDKKTLDEIPVQGQFGSYNSGKKSAKGSPTAGIPGQAITMKDLAKVGTSLVQKSAGLGKAGEKTTDPFNKSGALRPIGGTGAFNSVVQQGEMISSTEFETSHAFGAPKKTVLPNSELQYDDITGEALIARRSFGHVNSPGAPFDEVGNINQVMLTAKTVVALISQGEVITNLVKALNLTATADNESGPVKFPPGSPSAMTKGAWRPISTGQGSVQQQAIAIVAAPILDHNIEKCMARGLMAFLGYPDLAGSNEINRRFADGEFNTLDKIANAFFLKPALQSAAKPGAWDSTNLRMSSGFLVAILRNAIRDVGEGVLYSRDERIDSNPGDVLSIWRRLSNTATLKFWLNMAAIGNACLNAKKKKSVDDLPNTPVTRIAKSRVGQGDTLAWAHSQLPSRYLLPPTISWSMFNTGLGSFDDLPREKMADTYSNVTGVDDDRNEWGPMYEEAAGIVAASGNRITPEYVMYMEDKLELEYMPFYIQDLRTNQIIAFNAFIESIKDSYSADYSSTNGYGRIDPVMIYNKTSRSISITWTMAATSPEDFNAMWFDINMLTTMVYPQWSKGTPVQAGDDRFTMPFSQIPTASPMVRIRLGDVIKSNYSKLSLAKLFGAGVEPIKDSSYNIGAPDGAPSPSFEGTSYADMAAAQEAKKVWETTYRARIKAEPLTPEDTNGLQVGETAFLKPAIHLTRDEPDGAPDNKIEPPNATFGTTLEAKMHVKVVKRFYHPSPKVMYEVESVKGKDEPLDPYKPDHVHKYMCYHHDLEPELVIPAITTDSGWTSTKALEFYGEQNAIVRSFNSTMGRGLAGFITSLDFDYGGGGDWTWETDLGVRAPKVVKVSVSFSPIHDIAPGIDYMGANRAPLYTVGRSSYSMGGDPWAQMAEGEDSLMSIDSRVVQNYLALKADLTTDVEGE